MKKASKYVVKTVSAVLAIILLLGAMPTGALATEMDADQVAIFPAGEMNITQLAYEGYSHGQQNAIDFVPNGRVVAPFDATIAYMDANWGYVTLQSKEELKLPDGTLDYLTVGFMHDSDISDLYVGMELTQGQPFYDAGGMGDGNPWAYGSHVHMTVHRGHVKRGYPYGTGNMYAFDAMYIDPTFTTSYAGRGKGYAVSGMNNSAPSDYSNCWHYNYLKLCTYYPCYAKSVELTKSGTVYIKSFPCSRGTYSRSEDMAKGHRGENYPVLGLYLNTQGNYFYALRMPNGTVGYIFAGDAMVVNPTHSIDGYDSVDGRSLIRGYLYIN